ncbi:hypothetical protein ABT272_41220 [Streptomyces sp900105245]|uniref:Antibiotic biosynthesis monooxygenase n=1 Tax=Streptomyces sp. 900105245 TaxID=3154379 RepID=A0ABV1ULK6_9ACTN
MELLIFTVHRIEARAEGKVTEQLVNAFKKAGKENSFFTSLRRRPGCDAVVR